MYKYEELRERVFNKLSELRRKYSGPDLQAQKVSYLEEMIDTFHDQYIEDEDGNLPEDFDDFSLDNQNYDCICEFIKLNSSKIKSTVLRKFGDKYDSSPKNGAIYDFLQTLIDKGFLETYLKFDRKILPQYDPFFSEINELIPSLKIRMNFEPCPHCGFIPTFDVNCCPVCNRNS